MKSLVLSLILLLSVNTAFGARKEYGSWKRNAEGCNVRHEILREQAIELHGKNGKCNYDGIWEDYYTGKRLNDVSKIDIDHVLSVSEFNKKCRHKVNRSREEDQKFIRKFYNDKENLVASDKKVNRDKADKSKSEYAHLIKDPQRRRAYIEKYDRIWNKYCV
jgi:hypothetical protein